MTTLAPDAEKIVSGWLRDDLGVAAIVGRRVVGKTPSSTTEPWVKVVQLDDRDDPVSSVEHLHSYLLQLDCYAGYEPPDDIGHGQPEANVLGRTVRAVLKEMQGGIVDDVVVSAVRFINMARIPDTGFEPERERVVLTAQIWMHA